MPAFGRSTLGGIQGWWNKLDPESRSNGGKRQATWWLKASGGLTVETGGRDTRDEETDREVLSLKEEDCASVKQPFAKPWAMRSCVLLMTMTVKQIQVFAKTLFFPFWPHQKATPHRKHGPLISKAVHPRRTAQTHNGRGQRSAGHA